MEGPAFARDVRRCRAFCFSAAYHRFDPLMLPILSTPARMLRFTVERLSTVESPCSNLFRLPIFLPKRTGV